MVLVSAPLICAVLFSTWLMQFVCTSQHTTCVLLALKPTTTCSEGPWKVPDWLIDTHANPHKGYTHTRTHTRTQRPRLFRAGLTRTAGPGYILKMPSFQRSFFAMSLSRFIRCRSLFSAAFLRACAVSTVSQWLHILRLMAGELLCNWSFILFLRWSTSSCMTLCFCLGLVWSLFFSF